MTTRQLIAFILAAVAGYLVALGAMIWFSGAWEPTETDNHSGRPRDEGK